MSFSTIPDIIADIRAGRMVVIVDDEDRENEGDLIMAAEHATPEAIAFMIRHTSGILCVPMEEARLASLDLPQMVPNNEDAHRTAFTVSVDYRFGTSTGVSSEDRAATIRALASTASVAQDFARPGHIFPLRAQPGGVLTRAGHTEAAVDLARLAGLQTAGVLCEIMNADGTMARRPQLEEFAELHGLRTGSIADLIRYRLETEKTVARSFDRDVDTEFGRFRVVGYRDAITQLPHFALVRGSVDDGEPVLTRVHVRDTLSDVLHIARADGALSLSAAVRQVAARDRGVVVVLTDGDEARTALERLDRLNAPREADAALEWRRHGVGAQILADLGVRRLRVLGTPRRFLGLSGFGLEIVGYEEAGIGLRADG
ncbi:MAG TPA: 3,4-dihydroxy-2-butanone-4-phosphate synthase [Rhodanobacteraceae bacterium]|nr:3,4-dihydroxy-2-butanone-4-phosphate synthase [Rhodanobacteraceae bacterium]